MAARQQATQGARALRRAGRRSYRRLIGWLRAGLLGTITHVATEEPLAALTFDDGPDPQATPALLELLARHGARATFFVVGAQLRAHPELARQIVASGHALANHTDSHATLPDLSPAARRAEVAACAATIAPMGGLRLVRPPRGRQTVASRIDMLRVGHQVVTWSAHAEDWKPHPADELRARLEPQLLPGAIVLLHDRLHDPTWPAAADRQPMLTALDGALAATSGRLQFVTLPELLRSGRPARVEWFRSA
jgi:peptidoglycan/xylan/chitin deacetylase (PgdA/CDA1 family)